MVGIGGCGLPVPASFDDVRRPARRLVRGALYVAEASPMRRPSGSGVAMVLVMGMVIPACGLGAIAIMLDLPYLLIAAAVVVALAILTAWAME
jgi:hypothetical protein